MENIPDVVQTAIWVGVAAAVAALFSVIVKAINAWGDSLNARTASTKAYLGEQQAGTAVAAVEQTAKRGEASEDKLARALELAPLATIAQVEQQVGVLKQEIERRNDGTV